MYLYKESKWHSSLIHYSLLNKCWQTAEESETLEQRVIAAAAPMEAQRFSVITNNESAVSRETSTDDSPGMRVGAKVLEFL